MQPQLLTRNGKKLFAVVPYDEFVSLQERLEDAEDLYDLEQAIQEDDGSPGIPLEEVLKKYGMASGESAI